MKQKTVFKSILSVLLVSALVILGAVISKGNVVASDTTTDTCTAVWELYSANTENKYADYRSNGYTAPTKTDYVFAGWYDAENGIPLTEDGANAAVQAYAKFVPAHILTVKAQITEAWTYGQTEAGNAGLNTPVTAAAIRLITTVDSLKYQNIGFTMTIGEVEYDSIQINQENENDTKNIVYSKLYAVGEKDGTPIPYYPSSFCSMSTHFKTFTFTGIPVSDFNDYISAKAYWTTVDGTKVSGAESVKTVNLGRANGKATTTDGTFVNPFEALREDTVGENASLPYNLFYETFEDALKGTAGETKATVQLLKDIDVDAQITVNADLVSDEAAALDDAACTDITITNCVTELPVKNAADEVTITYSNSTTKESMFNITSGYALAIEGTAESREGIKLDGKQIVNNGLIHNQGTVTLKNATVQGGLATTYGGAIYNESANGENKTVIVDNCLFNNNGSSNNGGAIASTAGIVNIANSTFTSNYSKTNCAGAVFAGGGTTTVNLTGCELDGNYLEDKSKNGGAIYINNANATINLTNTMLKNHTAKDGGAIRLNAGTLKATGCTFSGNKAVAFYNSSATQYQSGSGGAIYLDNTATVTLVDSIFDGNTATYRGGAIGASKNTGVPKLKVSGTTFSNNEAGAEFSEEVGKVSADTAGFRGGAIWMSDVTVVEGSDNNTFTSNMACQGGAVYYTNSTGTAITLNGWKFEENGSESVTYSYKYTKSSALTSTTMNSAGGGLYIPRGTVTFDKTSSFENNAARDGGGVYCIGHATTANYTTANFEGTLFEGNRATGNCGGAIYLNTGAKLNTSESCTFKENYSSATDGKYDKNAGAIYVSNAAANTQITTANLVDTVFEGNKANKGGAILVNNGILKTNGCEFTDNISTTVLGGAIYVFHNDTSVLPTVQLNGTVDSPNIFSGNKALSGSELQDVYVDSHNTVDMAYCEFDSDGRVVLAMNKDEACTNSTAVATVNISGKISGGTFVYNGYNSEVTQEADGVKVAEAGLDATSDIRIAPYVETVDTQVLFGSTSATNGATINSIATSDGKYFTINSEGKLAYASVAKVGETEYATFAAAVTAAGSTGTITLLADAEVYSKVTATGTLTITTEEGKSATLYRGTGLAKNDMFAVGNGVTLNITGVTLDGRTAADAAKGASVATNTSAGRFIAITANGKVGLTNADLQYGYALTSGGGAVNCCDATLTATNCNFRENIAEHDGGAMKVYKASTLTVTDCNFINNHAACRIVNLSQNGGGGAVYLTGTSKATFNATEAGKYVFSGNTANRSGKYCYGAIQTNSKTNNAVAYSANYDFTNNTHYEYGVNGLGVGLHAAASSFASYTYPLARVAEVSDYDTLASIIENASTEHPTIITLAGNIAMEDRIDCSGKDIILTNKDADVEITWAETATAANMFKSANDGTLTIQGADLDSRTGITLNGNNKSSSALVYATEGNVVIKNITVINANSGGNGGAVGMNTSGILTAESCDFGQKVTDGDTTTYVNGNTASRGGAIYNGGANLQIVNCNFYGNKATVASGEGGGAICQNDNGHMSITGTGEFAGNEAKNQGGAIWTNDGKCVITGYDFVSNKSGGAGGALRVREKTGDYDIIMTDCDFTNNVSGAAAGAIYVSGGAEGYCTTLILAGTGTFSGNTCATNQYGSDIGLGGAKTATNLAVKYADESANYTFGGTVQYNDKTTCTISVLESVTE